MERQEVWFFAKAFFGGKDLLAAMGFVGTYATGYKHPCGAWAYSPNYDESKIHCTADEYPAMQEAAIASGLLDADRRQNFYSYDENVASVKKMNRYKSTFGF